MLLLMARSIPLAVCSSHVIVLTVHGYAVTFQVMD